MKKLQEPAKISHVVYLAIGVAVVLGGWYTVVQAVFISGPDIILAPASVEASGATNDAQQAFAEKQGVELTRDIRCDNHILRAGEIVDSHMIFYNTPLGGLTTSADKEWLFETEIICVMSNGSGLYQSLSNDLLGAPGTMYPGVSAGRGIENNDSYEVEGNKITVTMNVSGEGDWIRVVTRSLTPPDNLPPVVSCDIGVNPGGNSPEGDDKGKDEGGFYEFVAIDGKDGELELTITDLESGQVLGPVPNGATVKHTVSKGAQPTLRIGNGEIDYQLKTQGSIELSATDTVGNSATATCP